MDIVLLLLLGKRFLSFPLPLVFIRKRWNVTKETHFKEERGIEVKGERERKRGKEMVPGDSFKFTSTLSLTVVPKHCFGCCLRLLPLPIFLSSL
jgi:hypothetical protein